MATSIELDATRTITDSQWWQRYRIGGLALESNLVNASSIEALIGIEYGTNTFKIKGAATSNDVMEVLLPIVNLLLLP